MPDTDKIPELNLPDGIKWLTYRIQELESKSQRPILVGIAGASASGKTSRAVKVLHQAFKDKSVVITMDDYYFGLTYSNAHKLNLDQPESVNIRLLAEHLRALKEGRPIRKGKYSKITVETQWDAETVFPSRIIIVEGLFVLTDEIAEVLDLRAFFDIGAHGRIIRRLQRDSRYGETSWALLDNLKYMLKTAEPMYYRYIEPTKKNADIIIDNDYKPHLEAASSGTPECHEKFATTVTDDKLVKLGAERLLSARQTDYFYVPPDGSFRGPASSSG